MKARNAGRAAAGATPQRRVRRIWIAASICAVAASAAFGAAGTAAAAPPLKITINGKPMSSSGPQVTADLP